jgi:hypothetical protein
MSFRSGTSHFVGHSEDGQNDNDNIFSFVQWDIIRNHAHLYIHTNRLKIQWKYRMVKREYTITNPKKRRMKDENQTGGKTLAGLPQVQFTKKIRL